MSRVLKRNEVKFTNAFEGEPSGIYLYIHKRATDGSIFYVGKGIRDRYKSTNRTNNYWQNTALKHGVIVEILEQDLQEWYAFEREIELIAYYGRSDIKKGCLVNLDDGGSGGKKYHIETYDFLNYKTNELFTGTKYQFKLKFGFHPYHIINTENSHLNGWYLNGNLTDEILYKLMKGTTRFSSKIYDFVNFQTGMELSTTLSEFRKLTNVNPAHIVKGRKNSNHGWTTKETIERVGFNKIQNPFHDRYDNLPVYTFYNFENETVFIGTRVELTRKYSVDLGLLFKENGKVKYSKGWCLLENKDYLLQNYFLLTKYTFKHRNGEIFTGTRKEFRDKFKIEPESLFQTRKAKTCKGWSLSE